MPFEDVSSVVIRAAIEVHRALGPGLLESVYESCLARELSLSGVAYERQRSIPLNYKGIRIDAAYRLDLVVGNSLIVEVKSVEKLLPVHEAQALTYLRLTGIPSALIINFYVPALRLGLRRLSLPAPLP